MREKTLARAGRWIEKLRKKRHKKRIVLVVNYNFSSNVPYATLPEFLEKTEERTREFPHVKVNITYGN